MKLEPLTLEQCEQVRIWRNNEMECWRTPFMLTREMQEEFYKDIVCNRNSNHRYWAIIRYIDNNKNQGGINFYEFIGMGGITYIQWENSIGEITLIINPKYRKAGNGEKAVELLLDQAFNHLNLQTVFGEVYLCNGAAQFWNNIMDEYGGHLTFLPKRKYYKGIHFDSWYFSIDKGVYAVHNSNK